MKISEIVSRIFGKKSDDNELARAINEIFDTSQRDYTRTMLERVWFRNVLYYLGEQYIEYVKSMNTFRRKILPDFVPTPVSNEIGEYVRTVKAMYLGQRLVPKIVPNTTEKEDIEGAALGEALLEFLDIANDGDFHDEKEKVATAIPIFGVGFMRTFPKMDTDEWVFDKSGNPIKKGEVGCENVIPFQVFVDILGDSLNKKRWIGIQSLRPKEWVEDTFNVKVPSDSNASSVDYMRRLMKIVSQVSPWKGAGIETDIHTGDDNLVLFRELEIRPTIKFPDGRFLLSCGGKMLKKYDRMPIATKKGKWCYSLTDFHFDHIPGTFWSNAGVNNLISPQNIINEIDQSLAINRRGVARPKVITPGEIGIKRVDAVGSLGVGVMMLQYDPILAQGKAPEIKEGTSLPQQVLEERNIQRTVIQDVSGDPKNILRGKSPGSKASGIMVDILRETAERAHYPDTERYIRALAKVYKKRLLVAEEVMTEERIIKTCGRGNAFRIRKFKAADLRGNTDLRLELDSGLSLTNAGKMQILLDFAQKGLLGDVTQNVELREELLRRSGLAGFTEQENPDYLRASRENSRLASGEFQEIMLAKPNPKTGQIDPNSEVAARDPLFKYDNHQIHYEVHRKFMISPEFLELPDQVKSATVLHIDIHNMMVRQAMEAQKAEMLMGIPPEGEQSSPSGRPKPTTVPSFRKTQLGKEISYAGGE
jgi:hypothetical protein